MSDSFLVFDHPPAIAETEDGSGTVLVLEASAPRTVQRTGGENALLVITSSAGVGPAGAQGPAGRGVQSIGRTSGTGAAGTTDTYTITYTDGATSTFQIVNGAVGATGATGRGIASITRTAGTGTAGSLDTYTITYTDATTSTFQLLNGANGADGVDGTDGVDGLDGNTVLSGTTAPSNGLGVDGDYYINYVTSMIYGPKAAGVWPAGVSLVGAAGANGTNGTNGTTLRSGSGAPSNALGLDGDFYIDTLNSRLYGPKAAGAWPGTFTNLAYPLYVGPAGSFTDLSGIPNNAVIIEYV